jgi:hypothetical protein
MESSAPDAGTSATPLQNSLRFMIHPHCWHLLTDLGITKMAFPATNLEKKLTIQAALVLGISESPVHSCRGAPPGNRTPIKSFLNIVQTHRVRTDHFAPHCTPISLCINRAGSNI